MRLMKTALSTYTYILFIWTISLMNGAENDFNDIRSRLFPHMRTTLNTMPDPQSLAISHVTSADPPLDCNYVSYPQWEIYFGGTGVGVMDQMIRPIGLCFTGNRIYAHPFQTYANPFQPFSYKYACVNNDVFLLVWFADSCDDSSPQTYDVSSSGFKCDATTCDTVGIESWSDLDPDQCADGTFPMNISSGVTPYIVDTCLVNAEGRSDFVSDCDSSGNVVIQSYNTDNCSGTPHESITIPSTGICDEYYYTHRWLESPCSIIPDTTAIIPDTTAIMTTPGNTDSYDMDDDDSSGDTDSSDDEDISDSGEDAFYAVAMNGDSLLDEKEKHTADGVDYTMSVEFSDAMLRNMYGLFGVLMFANMMFCFLCRRRKTDQKRALQLQAEDALP
eukprot:736407_1